MTLYMVGWMAYVLFVFCAGIFAGYAYRREPADQLVEDMQNLIAYWDPDGSQREQGKIVRATQPPKLIGPGTRF